MSRSSSSPGFVWTSACWWLVGPESGGGWCRPGAGSGDSEAAVWSIGRGSEKEEVTCCPSPDLLSCLPLPPTSVEDASRVTSGGLTLERPREGSATLRCARCSLSLLPEVLLRLEASALSAHVWTSWAGPDRSIYPFPQRNNKSSKGQRLQLQGPSMNRCHSDRATSPAPGDSPGPLWASFDPAFRWATTRGTTLIDVAAPASPAPRFEPRSHPEHPDEPRLKRWLTRFVGAHFKLSKRSSSLLSRSEGSLSNDDEVPQPWAPRSQRWSLVGAWETRDRLSGARPQLSRSDHLFETTRLLFCASFLGVPIPHACRGSGFFPST